MGRPQGPDHRIRNYNGRGTTYTGKTVNTDRRTHGIRATYKDGCRCDPCRDAQAKYGRERYWKRKQEAA